MLAGGRLRGYPRRELCSLLLVFSVAFAARLAVWRLIPVDWNSDSYHHWQISYLSLKVGFPRWRMWDLNGCELYWGMVPHLVQAVLLFALSTASIVPYRVLNLLLGSVNPCIVYLIGRDNFNREVGAYAGLLFALYPVCGPYAIILQAIPFTIAHFGKPELETLSCIFGGSAFGYVAWRTRSFLYPFLIHWFIATLTIFVASGALG